MPVFGGYDAYLDMDVAVVQRFLLAWRAKKDAEAEAERRANAKTPPKESDDD